MSGNALAKLSQLGAQDYLEAKPLIVECLEQGLYQWTNPLYLKHLRYAIARWSQNPRTFLRAVICARQLASVMPSGIDDDIKRYFERLGSGSIGENDYPLRCGWPMVYRSIWNPKMFWQGQQIWQGRHDAAIFGVVSRNTARAS